MFFPKFEHFWHHGFWPAENQQLEQELLLCSINAILILITHFDNNSTVKNFTTYTILVTINIITIVQKLRIICDTFKQIMI